MIKHTQTPWFVSKLPMHPYYVIGPSVKLSDGSSEIADVATVLFTEEGKADADFICKAVNCHEELVAALEDVASGCTVPKERLKRLLAKARGEG